jgi:hypothetical protein
MCNKYPLIGKNTSNPGGGHVRNSRNDWILNTGAAFEPIDNKIISNIGSASVGNNVGFLL